MPFKEYKVYFSRTALGADAVPIANRLSEMFDAYGEHLPVANLSGEFFQMRDLRRIGSVWQGSFAKLRDDAPHVVSANEQERELDLADGEWIIEKCHFLYRTRPNVLVWQVNKGSGGLTRAQQYLRKIFETRVVLAQVMNDAELDRVMAGQIYEIDFAYDRPPGVNRRDVRWSQAHFDMMAHVEAAHAKFELRAPRKGGLAEAAKNLVRQLIGAVGVKKLRVRLTDESEPIELFLAPLKDTIRVELAGRYPISREVFEGLEQAYANQHNSIPG